MDEVSQGTKSLMQEYWVGVFTLVKVNFLDLFNYWLVWLDNTTIPIDINCL